MGVTSPRISIGLIVYNGENYLAKTVESLQAQSFDDFELIISDNASNDATEEICQHYAQRDARIRHWRNERNLGVAKNFNQTIAMSRGEFFKCTAHDDLYAPTFLARCVEVLDADPGAVLSHCTAKFIGPDGAALPFDSETGTYRDRLGQPLWPERPFLGESKSISTRFNEILREMRWCFPIFGVIRSEALKRTSLHRTFYGADKTLLVELVLLGRFRQIDEQLYMKRVHPEMSVYLNEHDKRHHIDPQSKQRLTVLRRAHAYLDAVLRAPLGWCERARCCGSILSKLAAHCVLRIRGADQEIPGARPR